MLKNTRDLEKTCDREQQDERVGIIENYYLIWKSPVSVLEAFV